MNQRDCKKCVYYGGKRRGKIFCLNNRCVKEVKIQLKKLTNRKNVVY